MAQITINIQTLDWTMGETVGLHLNPLLEFIDFSEIRNVKLDFSANFGDDKIKGVPCLEKVKNKLSCNKNKSRASYIK